MFYYPYIFKLSQQIQNEDAMKRIKKTEQALEEERNSNITLKQKVNMKS